MLKNSSARLFKVTSNEVIPININGNVESDIINVDDQELRIAYKNGYNQALKDNKLKAYEN